MSSENIPKKRKRKPENEEGPSKKRTVNGTGRAASDSSSRSKESTIKVTHVANSKSWTPVIVSAPGLTLPSGISFEAFRRVRTNELLLHSSDHPQLDYTAREHQEGGIENQLKHYIAIYDPAKGEAQVVEAKSLSIRSTLRAEEQEVRRQERAQKPEGLSHRQQLGLEFGTKKAKKAIESLSQNLIRTIEDPAAVAASPEAMKRAIQSNPAAAAVLESMADAAANAPSKDDLQAVIDEQKPRPKHDPDAKTPKDLYPIVDVVGDEVMRAVKVKPWFDAVEEGRAVETPSRFVAHRLQVIIEKDEDDAVEKVKILKWMLVLLKFYTSCRKVKGGGVKLPKREELKEKMGEEAFLIEAVRNKFAPGTSDMTKWHVDNLMTHMAAYSLIVDDFESDTYDLREDLGLGPRIMNQYFREIGAKINKMTEGQRTRAKFTQAEALDHKIAKLLVPPDFPKQNTIPPRRNR